MSNAPTFPLNPNEAPLAQASYPEKFLAEMRERLAKAGIPDDDPIMPLMFSFTDILERTWECAELITKSVDAVREAAKEDRAAMKKATEHCIAETLRLEATYDTMQIRADHLMTQTIESMADRFADKMHERTVIVEKRHNRWVLWRTGALIAAVLLSVLGAGVAWRAYLDRAATGMLERCATTVVQDRTTGQFYCPYGYTPPPY